MGGEIKPLRCIGYSQSGHGRAWLCFGDGDGLGDGLFESTFIGLSVLAEIVRITCFLVPVS